MTKEQVIAIARGRVWTGLDALEIGLVDNLGGLKDAIAYAAKHADIKDQRVLYYPQNKEDKFLELLEEYNEEDNGNSIIRSRAELPAELQTYYKELSKIGSRTGIQMRLPFDIFVR
jgi:protease-4